MFSFDSLYLILKFNFNYFKFAWFNIKFHTKRFLLIATYNLFRLIITPFSADNLSTSRGEFKLARYTNCSVESTAKLFMIGLNIKESSHISEPNESTFLIAVLDEATTGINIYKN